MSNVDTRNWIIINSIQLALYSLVFLFFTFVLVKVSKTQNKSQRCAFILMVICLQLAAFCSIIWNSLYMW